MKMDLWKIPMKKNYVDIISFVSPPQRSPASICLGHVLFLLPALLFFIVIGVPQTSPAKEKSKGYHTSGKSPISTHSTLKRQATKAIALGSQPPGPNPKSRGTQDDPSSPAGIRLMEAVRVTLANQPAIFFQEEETKINKGTAQIETGRFDTTLDVSVAHNHEEIPLSAAEREATLSSDLRTDETTASLGLRKLFRTGVSINPSVQTIRDDTSPSDFDPVATGRVDFLITVPLLKGLGVEATGADELKAKNDYEVSLLTLHHTVSQTVLNTTVEYWTYLASDKMLQELTDSESRAQKMLENMKELVKAGEVPAADLEQAEANLASKTAARLNGEQDLFETRQNLGLTVGLPYKDFQHLPLPADTFPELVGQDIRKIYASLESFIMKSLARRADYQASKKSQDSDKILVGSAKNNLKPQLDLDLNFGYSGLDEGNRYDRMATSLTRNIPGASVSATLLYAFPVKNNSARGLLFERMSRLRQSIIQTKDLARNIHSNVAVALSAVKNNLAALEKSRKAVESYGAAVENEKTRYLLGLSTLIDIIETEDRLTSAGLDEISAHLNLTQAVANLRFETATLVSPSSDGRYTVTMEGLTTIPLDLINPTKRGQ